MIRLITFADSKFQKAAKRLAFEAKELGEIDEIIIYNDDNFEDDYYKTHGDWIESHPRGHGYWIWKSYFSLRSLNQMREDDILVYLDAGCAINFSNIKKFNYYIHLVQKSQLGLVCFFNGYTEKHWDKGDVIDFFECRNNDEILNSMQIMSGVWIARKNKRIIRMFEDWYRITNCYHYLIDDTPSKSPNEDGFVENRHDQSIFSLLIKNYGGAVILPDSEVEVDYYHRKEGWLTYRRYKNNVFLAIRDTAGIIYNSEPTTVFFRNMKCDVILFKEKCLNCIKTIKRRTFPISLF